MNPETLYIEPNKLSNVSNGAARTNCHRVATATASAGDSDQYQSGYFLDDFRLGYIDLLLDRALAEKAVGQCLWPNRSFFQLVPIVTWLLLTPG